MKIYHNIEDFKGVEFPVVTIGTFDGVHIGHQKIIRSMQEKAHKLKGETVLITFFPHPRLVIHPDSKNLKFINSRQKKIELLEKAGIDHLIIIPFTKEFSKITSASFVKDILVAKVRVRKLIIGYDHHFGKNRLGDFETLYDLGQQYGFEVEKIPVQDVDNIAVSSTKIRKALQEGKVEKANKLLGYTYSISGKVVRGNNLGEKLGFPTANIALNDPYKLVAANGVYACFVEHEGEKYKGMANIGIRPTLTQNDLTIEVHIFDFAKNIYEQNICIYFVERLREEMKFENMQALQKQLTEDKQKVKEILQLSTLSND